MCLTDLAVQSGYTIREESGVYDAAGNYFIRDFRRAVWIYGHDSDLQFRLAALVDGTLSYQIPARVDLTTTVAGDRTYHREQFAGVPPGCLVAKGTAASTVVVHIVEYDRDVDKAVMTITGKGFE